MKAHCLATVLAALLLSATVANAQQPKTNQVSTQWQATQNFLQSIQNQINQLKGDSGLSIAPGGAGQFAGYNANGTVLSPMVAPVSPGNAGQMAGYPASGSTVGPLSAVSNLSVNGVLNPLAFPGSDIGAQVNAAMASAPSGTVIRIPPGSYSFNTTIQCPTSNWTYYIIEGAGSGRASDGTHNIDSNTFLSYTGNGDAISQVITSTTYQNSKGCELRDLTLDGVTAGANAVGFHFGGTEHTRLLNVKVQNFLGASGVGIEAENASGLWTERIETQNFSIGNDQVGIWFHCDAGCTPSHSHENISAYVNLNSGQTALLIDGGTTTAGSMIEFNGNVALGSSATGAMVHVTGNSAAFGTNWTLGAECNQSGGCTRFRVDAGSDVGGFVTRPTVHLNANGNWSDTITGTNELYGFVAGAGYNPFTVGSLTTGAGAFNAGVDHGSGTITAGSGLFLGNQQIGCAGPPSVSGGGALAAGATSFSGAITGLVATGNVLTIGCTCPHALTAIMTDDNGGQVQYTNRTATSITFNATAGHVVDYQASCY